MALYINLQTKANTMDNTRNLFYIVGRKRTSSLFGSYVSKNDTAYIAPLSDYCLKNIGKAIEKRDRIWFDPAYDCQEGDITLFSTEVVIMEYRPATEQEVATFDETMARHNLVYETRTMRHLRLSGSVWDKNRKPYMERKPLLATYYKRKGDFVIVLNGKPTYYRNFRRKGLKEGELVILHGDNGYSHCWSETFNGKALRGVIDDIFSRKYVDTTKNSCDGMRRLNRALKGELYGWNFDRWGRLVVNTTFQQHRFSQVSDS